MARDNRAVGRECQAQTTCTIDPAENETTGLWRLVAMREIIAPTNPSWVEAPDRLGEEALPGSLRRYDQGLVEREGRPLLVIGARGLEIQDVGRNSACSWRSRFGTSGNRLPVRWQDR